MLQTGESLFKMRPAVLIAFIAAFALVAIQIDRAESSDLASCANVEDDAKRLACYDLLAKESLFQEDREPTAEPRDESAEREKIIERCRKEMGEYGSAMVKYCAEEDIAAYRALQRYPVEHSPFVERCIGEMGPYGWSMVKYCADEDIEAERALSDMMAE